MNRHIRTKVILWILCVGAGSLWHGAAICPAQAPEAAASTTFPALESVRFIPPAESLSGTLSISYSGTSELFLERMFAKLKGVQPGVRWHNETMFTHSGGVVNFLLQRKTPLGVTSGPMRSADKEQYIRDNGYPLLEARIAVDALQILVHPSNPLERITVPQLDAIFGKELRAGELKPITQWSQLTADAWAVGRPIASHAGWLHYGTSRFFKQMVLEDGAWKDNLETIGVVQHPEMYLAGNENAICFSNFKPRDGTLKILSVARQSRETAYPPLPEYIYNEDYPLVRFFYVYVDVPALTDVEFTFLDYLLSYEGQQEIAATGSMPLDLRLLLRGRTQLGLMED